MQDEKKVKVLKKLFEKDIESFGEFFFKNHLKNKTPDFHREIYRMYESGLKRIALGAPRGHAKSTISDLVYLAWEIVNNRQRFVLLVSDTYSQATLFLEALKAEFESNERLREFYGDLTSNNWSESEIIVNGIMVKAIGAGMKVRGLKYRDSRPTLILVDDLENDELVENKERREKLERWFNGALVPSMDKEGRVVVIGTILHYDSLLCKMLKDDKYTEYEKRTYKAITDGKALWPEHLSYEELDKIKRDYIEKGQGYLFYQEYQNDPVSDENRKFKIEKFKYYEDKDLEGKQVSTSVTYDRAYSLDKTADFTGKIVVSVDRENNWYIRQAVRLKVIEKDLITDIFDTKEYFSPEKMGIEQKAYEYTIKPALEDEMKKRNSFFLIEELKDGGTAKNKRIEGLLPRFENGTIFFKRDQADLIDELISFPKAPHDDLADGLAHQLTIAKKPEGEWNEEDDLDLNTDW